MSNASQKRALKNYRNRLNKRGMAEANDCVLVTDNEKDFAGLKIFNPSRTGT